MGFGKLFNTPQHKRFHIEPRYWDPEKEEREKRIRMAKAELGLKDDDGTYIPNIKGRMQSELRHKYTQSRQIRRKSNLRFLIILALLLLAAYAYIFGWDSLL